MYYLLLKFNLCITFLLSVQPPLSLCISCSIFLLYLLFSLNLSALSLHFLTPIYRSTFSLVSTIIFTTVSPWFLSPLLIWFSLCTFSLIQFLNLLSFHFPFYLSLNILTHLLTFFCSFLVQFLSLLSHSNFSLSLSTSHSTLSLYFLTFPLISQSIYSLHFYFFLSTLSPFVLSLISQST